MHDRHCGPLRKCTSAGTGLFRGVPLPLIKYLLLNTRLVMVVTLTFLRGYFVIQTTNLALIFSC